MDPCIKEKDLATLQSEVKAIFKRMDEQLGVTRAVYELTAEICGRVVANLNPPAEKLSKRG